MDEYEIKYRAAVEIIIKLEQGRDKWKKRFLASMKPVEWFFFCRVCNERDHISHRYVIWCKCKKNHKAIHANCLDRELKRDGRVTHEVIEKYKKAGFVDLVKEKEEGWVLICRKCK